MNPAATGICHCQLPGISEKYEIWGAKNLHVTKKYLNNPKLKNMYVYILYIYTTFVYLYIDACLYECGVKVFLCFPGSPWDPHWKEQGPSFTPSWRSTSFRHGGTPIAGWVKIGNSYCQWMMVRATTHDYGNLHMRKYSILMVLGQRHVRWLELSTGGCLYEWEFDNHKWYSSSILTMNIMEKYCR